MSRRALIEHRPYLLISLLAAAAYYFLSESMLGDVYLTVLKGASVGFLAVYAARRTTGFDATILVIALALSAVADMVLIYDFVIGGAFFFASHVVAVVLYLRNRRDSTTTSQRMLAAGLLIGAPLVSYLLSQDPKIALYASSLGAMAAAAWMSRFPRYQVGIGAVLFVVSDWLIFSRLGPFNPTLTVFGSEISFPDLLVWPLYYAGQLMIATGVVQTLRREQLED